MAPNEIEQIATAVGKAVGEAVTQAITATLLPAIAELRGDMSDLRREVFGDINNRLVTKAECTRTHEALPVVEILKTVGIVGVLGALLLASKWGGG